jgi:hypothetical protein
MIGFRQSFQRGLLRHHQTTPWDTARGPPAARRVARARLYGRPGLSAHRGRQRQSTWVAWPQPGRINCGASTAHKPSWGPCRCSWPTSTEPARLRPRPTSSGVGPMARHADGISNWRCASWRGRTYCLHLAFGGSNCRRRAHRRAGGDVRVEVVARLAAVRESTPVYPRPLRGCRQCAACGGGVRSSETARPSDPRDAAQHQLFMLLAARAPITQRRRLRTEDFAAQREIRPSKLGTRR